MVTQLIKCSNNLALPPVEKKIFIDLDLKITQIKKHLRDEFNLDHTKFVIFFECCISLTQKNINTQGTMTFIPAKLCVRRRSIST